MNQKDLISNNDSYNSPFNNWDNVQEIAKRLNETDKLEFVLRENILYAFEYLNGWDGQPKCRQNGKYVSFCAVYFH